MRPHALHPGAIQGKEGIKFCHLATLAAGAARAEALVEMEAAAEDERLTDTTTTIILIITRRITLRPAAALPPVAGGGIQGRRSVDSAPRFIGFILIAPEIVYLSFLRTVVSQMNN